MARDRTNLKGRIAEIMALTDHFCDERFDADFRDLCRSMLAALVAAGVSLDRGKAAGWAAGIIFSVGYVICLIDPSKPYHITADRVGVSSATLMNRARVIREVLDLPFVGQPGQPCESR